MRHNLADTLATRAGSVTALIVIFAAFFIAVFDIAGVMSPGKSDRLDTSAIANLDMSGVLTDLNRLSELNNRGAIPSEPEMLAVLTGLQQRVGVDAPQDNSAVDIARVQVTISDVEAALKGVLVAGMQPQSPEYQERLSNAIEESIARIETLNRAIDRFLPTSVAASNDPSSGGISGLILSSGLLALLAVVAGGVSLVLLRREVQARQQRVIAEERADFLTRHDPMTGLPNAQEFDDHVSSVAKGQGAVLVLDLDNFTQINDRRGRAFGDAVIKEVAWRLARIGDARGGVVARLGGSRFGLHVPSEAKEALSDLCKSIVQKCGKPIVMGAQTLAPAISLGAVPLSGLNNGGPTDCDAILRVASFALADSKAKSSGFTILDNASDIDVTQNLSLIEALPRAIHDKLLEVHLQPRMSLVDGGVLGFEALVRWCHNGDFVPASQIIELAEETGIIIELDHYMLDRAVGIVADWNRRRKTCFPVSVNLSTTHFRHEDGFQFVTDTLQRHGFPAEQLTIEVAESVRFERNPDLLAQFETLRAAGCRISIDDFGTGFTSFATLQSLGADEIKIDPSLVSKLDETDEAKLIFDAVLRMGRNLQVDIIVEGVEREAQADLLRTMGCQNAQGFHFGKPRPAAEWLADATYGADEAKANDDNASDKDVSKSA